MFFLFKWINAQFCSRQVGARSFGATIGLLSIVGDDCLALGGGGAINNLLVASDRRNKYVYAKSQQVFGIKEDCKEAFEILGFLHFLSFIPGFLFETKPFMSASK